MQNIKNDQIWDMVNDPLGALQMYESDDEDQLTEVPSPDASVYRDVRLLTLQNRSTGKEPENTVPPPPPPYHYKVMCNVVVNDKRKTRNSPISKAIVEACATDGIHLINAFKENGEEWSCFGESQKVSRGSVVHMYYGDLNKGNSKHFVGKVLSSYDKFSNDVTIDEFPRVKKVWPQSHSNGSVFCRVDWKEVKMTPEDEYMLKNPGKNGFKVQGTILRVL
jgi:hypothetical protein